MTKASPDWERLRCIGAEVESLLATGSWNRDTFVRLFLEAEDASNGHGDFTEFVANEAWEDSWFDAMVEERNRRHQSTAA